MAGSHCFRIVCDRIRQAVRFLDTGFLPLVASFWAARNCALLFGLGAMVGAWRLLGRALSLGGASDEAEEGERGVVGERMAWTEEGREVDPVLDGARATGCLTSS